MANRNICKFHESFISDSFYVSRFVYETNESTMKKVCVAEENRLYLISGGSAVFDIDSKIIRVQTGELLFCFKGERIAAVQTNECEYIYIDFGGTRAKELFGRFGIIDGNRKFAGFDGMIPLWHESLSRATEENIDLSAESILLYSFSRLSSFTPKGNPLINKIIRLSEENFKESGFGINAVAEELGYNAKYISYIFKRKTGVAYSEYLRELRINYAISLFDHGLDSVKNAAALSGFSDPLYFSTVFKKCVGMTPKEYKKGLPHEL